jgi:hypothetical protein
MAGMPGIDGNMDWILPLPPGKPANPGIPPKAANGFAAAEEADDDPALACAASFCHKEGSATERHVLSHCSNIFCVAAGSAPGTPEGVFDAGSAALALAEGRDEPDEDEEDDLEAAISAFDLSVPKD